MFGVLNLIKKATQEQISKKKIDRVLSPQEIEIKISNMHQESRFILPFVFRKMACRSMRKLEFDVLRTETKH